MPWGTGEKEEKFYTEFMSIPLNSKANILKNVYKAYRSSTKTY